MANNIGRDIIYGFQAGQKARGVWDERQAGKAMGELAGYNPMQGQSGEQEEGGGMPDTRSWTQMRQEVLKKVGRLGPDAVKEAMDEIDEIQNKGTLDNLYQARELIQQGNQEAAGKYVEAANSYQGNFMEVRTSPAKMRDGSTELAFEVRDEQTGYPRMPGGFVTLDVIDRLIMQAENPGKYGAARHDRDMALKEWEMKQDKYGYQQYKDQRDYDYQQYTGDRGYNLDVAKAQQAARPKPQTYKSKDYDDAIDTRLKRIPVNIETGQPGITAEQVQAIQTLMAAARSDPTLSAAPPDVIADRIFSKVLGPGAE